MQYHKQLFLHDPDNGVFGDCHRTALACLLDKQPKEVPHFLEGNPDGVEFIRREREYLETQGLSLFQVAYADTIENVLATVGQQNPGLRYILGGKSPRGTNHSVVCCGSEIIHDPHPDSGGLVAGIDPDGYCWVDVLIPLGMVA